MAAEGRGGAPALFLLGMLAVASTGGAVALSGGHGPSAEHKADSAGKGKKEHGAKPGEEAPRPSGRDALSILDRFAGIPAAPQATAAAEGAKHPAGGPAPPAPEDPAAAARQRRERAEKALRRLRDL